MREVLEEVITHSSGVDPTTLEAVHQYTKLFWLNTGPFNNLTARKFIMKTTPSAFAAAAAAAAQGGARFPVREGETVAQMMARLAPPLLRPRCRSDCHEQGPSAGRRPSGVQLQQPL